MIFWTIFPCKNLKQVCEKVKNSICRHQPMQYLAENIDHAYHWKEVVMGHARLTDTPMSCAARVLQIWRDMLGEQRCEHFCRRHIRTDVDIEWRFYICRSCLRTDRYQHQLGRCDAELTAPCNNQLYAHQKYQCWNYALWLLFSYHRTMLNKIIFEC